MAQPCGVVQEGGWFVKANSSGGSYSLESGLQPIFNQGNVKTLPDAFRCAADAFQHEPCMATRQLLERKFEDVNGKMFEKQRLGEYTWRTYEDVKNSIDAIGWGLRTHGINPGDRLAIFAETRAEWFMSAFGALQHRITVCTIYTTLSDSGVTHALNETEVPIVITSYDYIERMKKLLPELPHVKKIIVIEDQIDGIGKTKSLEGVEIIPFKVLLNNGEVDRNKTPPTPDPEDTAILMYTSGSTGVPKGVELSHSNILTSVIAYSVQMKVGPGDRYLAFLPLAHIMELVTEISLVSLGATILYSNPNTLTSASTKVMKGCKGDAFIGKPTVMNAVPLVLDRIIKGVLSQVEKAGWLKSTIFSYAVWYKYWLEYIPFTGTLLNLLIFRRIQQELGGKLRKMAVGGAPLSPQTHDNMRAIFGVSLQVGYGTTETSTCICGMNSDDITTGRVGGPNLGVLVRLIDWKEGGYLSTDKPFARGEIVVGGPVVTKGYFKRPNETEESYFEENGIRWFKTGDIAEVDQYGSFKIIDRKKDLVKLKHGEYISLGDVESKLKTHPLIDNICVFADSTQEHVVAVIVPVQNNLAKEAESLGIENVSEMALEELCCNEFLANGVIKRLQEHGKKCGLNKYDIPAAVHLSPEIWMPDTGLVTAALKLKRVPLRNKFEAEIAEMYHKLS